MSRGARSKVDAKALRLLGPGAITLLRRVGQVASAAGARAYLVGGPVRDVLLRRASRDLDVVVVGDAIQIAARLRRKLGGRLVEHAAFGTATLELADRRHLDLATARRERYSAPAALPRVEPSGLEDDLWRRDFTINCLALELSGGRFGSLIDPTGGLADLRASRIRALHDRSFIDDPTRSFRAAGFASRLGFVIGASTARWMSAASRPAVMRRLSSARLRRALASALNEPDLPRTLGLLQRRGVLAAVDPGLRFEPAQRAEIERLDALLTPGNFSPKLDLPPRWIAAVTLLSLHRSWRQRVRVLERLRPPRRWARGMRLARREGALLHRRLAGQARPRPSEVSAACRGLSSLAVLVAAAGERRASERDALLRFLTEWSGVRADISGKDLIAAGVPQGPRIARALSAALAVKLDGPRRDREAQLAAATRAARLTGSAGID